MIERLPASNYTFYLFKGSQQVLHLQPFFQCSIQFLMENLSLAFHLLQSRSFKGFRIETYQELITPNAASSFSTFSAPCQFDKMFRKSWDSRHHVQPISNRSLHLQANLNRKLKGKKCRKYKKLFGSIKRHGSRFLNYHFISL